jgi:hypothetical protein
LLAPLVLYSAAPVPLRTDVGLVQRVRQPLHKPL